MLCVYFGLQLRTVTGWPPKGRSGLCLTRDKEAKGLTARQDFPIKYFMSAYVHLLPLHKVSWTGSVSEPGAGQGC